MNRSQSFYKLTPEAVLESVERAGFSPTGHCLQLNSLENRVYDLKLEDGSHLVSKFYRPGRWTANEILEEHRFLFDLRDSQIPVCVPIHFLDGSSLQETEGLYFAVWPRTGGRAPDELGASDLLSLGRFLGRIHNVGAVLEVSRPKLTADYYIREPVQYMRTENLIPERFVGRYEKCAEECAEKYETLVEGIPLIGIHGDCHKGNLLRSEEGFFLLDFDDFLLGPAIQDIWLLLPSPSDPEYQMQLERLISGYEEFREFPREWISLIEPLRTLRYVRYAGWIARRREDPAFVAAFPEFGTDDYWEQETLDLEEQCKKINTIRHTGENRFGVVHSVPESEEAELSNKDFFWDWEE